MRAGASVGYFWQWMPTKIWQQLKYASRVKTFLDLATGSRHMAGAASAPFTLNWYRSSANGLDSNRLKSKYSLFQILPRIFYDILASIGKLGEVNKHLGVLGIPAMLACTMAREVFTTASANETDGSGDGGVVVAGPVTWAWSVVLCGDPTETSSRVAGGTGVAELVASWVEAETARECALSVLEPLAKRWVTASVTVTKNCIAWLSRSFVRVHSFFYFSILYKRF